MLRRAPALRHAGVVFIRKTATRTLPFAHKSRWAHLLIELATLA